MPVESRFRCLCLRKYCVNISVGQRDVKWQFTNNWKNKWLAGTLKFFKMKSWSLSHFLTRGCVTPVRLLGTTAYVSENLLLNSSVENLQFCALLDSSRPLLLMQVLLKFPLSLQTLLTLSLQILFMLSLYLLLLLKAFCCSSRCRSCWFSLSSSSCCCSWRCCCCRYCTMRLRCVRVSFSSRCFCSSRSRRWSFSY